MKRHSKLRRQRSWLGTVLIMGCLSLPTKADGEGHWRRLPDMLQVHDGAGVALVGTKIYVFGGVVTVPPFTTTAYAEVYDADTNSWRRIAPMPEGRAFMGACSLDGRIYSIGGWDESFHSSREVFIYDPPSDRWSEGVSLPSYRANFAAASFGGRIYIFGGDLPSTEGSSLIFEPGVGWTRGAELPTPRSGAAAVSVGAFIYVVGGFAQPSSYLPVNERYDPRTDRWESLAPMPTPRSHAATASWGGRIFVFGGGYCWTPPNPAEANESYSPLTNSWTTGPPLGIPRLDMRAIALRDRIIVPGGRTCEYGSTAVVEAFFPDSCAGADPYCFCAEGGRCGNDDPSGGCTNSTGFGALLTGSGSASIAVDSLVLLAQRMPTSQAGVFWVAAGRLDVPFGDGRLCISSGGVRPFRFPIQSSGLRGQIVLGPGVVAQASGRIAITPGSTWNFQAWYRDPLGPCGYAFNTTNALAVSWAP